MKMAAKIRFLFLAAALALTSTAGTANDSRATEVFAHVAAMLKAGEADSLGARLASTVDLQLPELEIRCSNKDATRHIQTFFARSKPSGFALQHVGGRAERHYCVGLLSTGAGRFRTTVFVNIQAERYTILLLRIEHED
jgi:hypothetical protein